MKNQGFILFFYLFFWDYVQHALILVSEMKIKIFFFFFFCQIGNSTDVPRLINNTKPITNTIQSANTITIALDKYKARVHFLSQ